MANQWTIPYTDRQGQNVIPPTPEYPGRIFQPNMPVYQQNEYPTFQNCYCAQCSAIWHAQAEPPNWYPAELSAGTPFLNRGQNAGDRAETAMIVPGAQAQAVPWPQTARIPDNFGYTLADERAGPSNVDLIRDPVIDESIREGRRRLAGRYVNNPNAYVSTIRLEPSASASGQLQVIITLEMVSLL